MRTRFFALILVLLAGMMTGFVKGNESVMVQVGPEMQVALPLIPGGPVYSGGMLFVVDSTAGTGANAVGAGTWDRPYSTINYANTRCRDNEGDIIVAKPGHIETVSSAGGLDLDCVGVTVVFLGTGTDQARINFTATGADMDIDGANISLVNPRFTFGIDAVTAPLDVNSAYFRLFNGTVVGGTGIDPIDFLMADANADYLLIDGMTYLPGNESGSQKESLIQIVGADRPTIRNVEAFGNFNTAVIENVSTAWTNAILEDVTVGTSNASGLPLTRLATARTSLKNVQLRDAAGVIGSDSEVSVVGQITGGVTGGIIFADTNNFTQTDASYWTGKSIRMLTGPNAGVSRPVVAFSTIGDAVTVEPGFPITPLTVGERFVVVSGDIHTPAIGVNDGNNSFDSSAVVANRDGSELEREEELADDADAALALLAESGGLVFRGTIDALVASTTVLPSAELAGYGNDYFNTDYALCIQLNFNSPAAAPQRECRDITDYVSSTGTFTTVAFSVNVEASDEIMVVSDFVTLLGQNNNDNVATTSAVVANSDGSIPERLEDLDVNVGAPAGASVSADIAAVKLDTGGLVTEIGSAVGADISADIAAVKADTGGLVTEIGNAVGADISADIAAVKADTGGLVTEIGSAVGADISADIAAVKADTGGLVTEIGNAVGADISADIAAVKADTGGLVTELGNAVGADISADIAAVKADTGGLVTEIGSAVGADISADIAAVKADTGGLVTEIGSAVGADISADIAAVKTVADTTSTNALGANDHVGRTATANGATLPASTQSVLFTIPYPIILHEIVGWVTSGLEVAPCNLKVVYNPTVGADTDLSATLDVSGKIAGTMFSITKSNLAAALRSTGNGLLVGDGSIPIILNAGSIDLSTDATITGQVAWELRYEAFVPGSGGRVSSSTQ